jgi:hypothetical protein
VKAVVRRERFDDDLMFPGKSTRLGNLTCGEERGNGAFADPDFPPPKVSVYESRRHPWVTVPDGAKQLD